MREESPASETTLTSRKSSVDIFTTVARIESGGQLSAEQTASSVLASIAGLPTTLFSAASVLLGESLSGSGDGQQSPSEAGTEAVGSLLPASPTREEDPAHGNSQLVPAGLPEATLLVVGTEDPGTRPWEERRSAGQGEVARHRPWSGSSWGPVERLERTLPDSDNHVPA